MAGVLIGVAFAIAYAALLLNRRTREAMAKRKKALRIAGGVLLALGLLILVPGLSLLPESTWPMLVNAMPIMVLTAVALIMVPGAAEQMPADEAEAKAKMGAVRSVRFSGLREAAAAIITPVTHFRDAVKAVAAWVLASWAWMVGSYWLMREGSAPAPAIAALIGFAVIVSFGFAAAAVVWHRRLLEDLPVGWVRLDGAVWGYFWRLWVAAFLFGAFDRLVSGWTPAMADALRLPEETVVAWLPWLIGAVTVLAFANFALMLPARAVGARLSPFSVAASFLPWLGVGLVLTLTPYVVALWLSNQLQAEGVFMHLQLLLNLVVMFAAVIAAATYLSRAYAAARAALAS